ncbi:MAG: hypothetical protein MUC33_10490 [Desulfobacterales bacterium]|nr:hypothetical protein [Desulfobacterales bacterium]
MGFFAASAVYSWSACPASLPNILHLLLKNAKALLVYNPSNSRCEMLFIRLILGALFFGTVIGIVLAVLLASNYREQTLLFLHSMKPNFLNFVRKFKIIFRSQPTV